MSDDVSDWHPGFLAQIYEEITPADVVVEDDPSVQVSPPKVTRVDDSETSVLVEFIAVNPDTLNVEPYQKRINRDEILRATESHERTTITKNS